MGHEAAKKSTDSPIPIQRVNEKMSDSSCSVSVLSCIMAGEMPISVKILKKAMMTVAMATIPKSSGEREPCQYSGHHKGNDNTAVFGKGGIEYTGEKLLFEVTCHRAISFFLSLVLPVCVV